MYSHYFIPKYYTFFPHPLICFGTVFPPLGQDGLELREIFLPQFPKCWEYRCEQSQLLFVCLFTYLLIYLLCLTEISRPDNLLHQSLTCWAHMCESPSLAFLFLFFACKRSFCF